MSEVMQSSSGAPLLSIVIPVRGKANELWFTLQGLMHAGFNEHVEILVVDNEPSADVREVCEYFQGPAFATLRPVRSRVSTIPVL